MEGKEGGRDKGGSRRVIHNTCLVHHVYRKPGGVPDKLCVFPADES